METTFNMSDFDDTLQPNISGNTHKALFLNPDTLEIMSIDYISPEFELGIDTLKASGYTAMGIQVPYIIVEKDYSQPITREVLTDFQREIALKVLERNFKNKQVALLNESEDFDEYLAKDTALKKLYFNVKKEIMISEAPLAVNLTLE